MSLGEDDIRGKDQIWGLERGGTSDEMYRNGAGNVILPTTSVAASSTLALSLCLATAWRRASVHVRTNTSVAFSVSTAITHGVKVSAGRYAYESVLAGNKL